MKSDNIYIFSYGSNLLEERIRARVKSVEVVGISQLKQHKLVFNKPGADGSAKANIMPSSQPEDQVWGVVHKMTWSDKLLLDHIERGYDFRPVKTSHGVFQSYVASSALSKGDPFCWYIGLIIAGAVENGFPKLYIRQLEKILTRPDLNDDRRKSHECMFRRNE